MHLGVVAVAQPVPVVDALVAVRARSTCGRGGRDGRCGSDTAGFWQIARSPTHRPGEPKRR